MRSVTKSSPILPYRPTPPFSGGLLLALGVSLMLHGGLLAYRSPAVNGESRPPLPSPPPPPVQATLKLPPVETPAPAPPLFLPEPRQAEPSAPASTPVAPKPSHPHPGRPLPPQVKPLPAKAPPKPGPEIQQPASPQRQVERAVKAALVYPPEAIARGLQGVVLVRIFFDEGGRVIAARVDRSSGHAILDEAAKRAAQTLTSLPGAPQEVTIPVGFSLH